MIAPIVRPAGEADIGAVVALLHERMNARIAPERWRLILDYPWRPADVERGWLVEDRGRIVGFMGTIYSDRVVGGQIRRFCDLSSWYLMRDYRGDGIGDVLLRAGMARPDVTYQTMTARRATGRKIRALGFCVLDATRRVVRPQGREALAALRDPAAIREALDPDQRHCFDLHRGFGLEQAFFPTLGHDLGQNRGKGLGKDLGPGHGLWLVWQRKLKGEGIAYHEVLHASHPDALSRHAQRVANTIVTGDTGLLAVDSRWMTAGTPAGDEEAIPLARWYRSPNVGARAVDHLFSEVILLDQKLP